MSPDDPAVDGFLERGMASAREGATAPLGAEVTSFDPLRFCIGREVCFGFSRMAGLAEDLEIARGVGAVKGKRNDMVYIPAFSRHDFKRAPGATSVGKKKEGEPLL